MLADCDGAAGVEDPKPLNGPEVVFWKSEDADAEAEGCADVACAGCPKEKPALAGKGLAAGVVMLVEVALGFGDSGRCDSVGDGTAS